MNKHRRRGLGGMAANALPPLPRTCSDAQGRPKVCFTSTDRAMAYAGRGAPNVDVYRCPTCRMLHLAHKRTDGQPPRDAVQP